MSRAASAGQTQTAAPAALFESVGFLLSLLGAESRRRFVDALGAHDLRLSQYGALMVLAETGPIPQQRLARSIDMDPRNVVPVVDSLEQRGLVQRRPDPIDRRRHQVGLTPAGQQFFEGVREGARRVEGEMLAGLSETQRSTLLDLLARLYSAISTS